MRYQMIVFGCVQPLADIAGENHANHAAMIANWMDSLAKCARIQLHWATDTELFSPLTAKLLHHGDIFGVLIAVSDEYAVEKAPELPNFDRLDEFADTAALAELCLPLWQDIQTAMTRWEIVRFSAQGIALDLPAGRLFLVQGQTAS